MINLEQSNLLHKLHCVVAAAARMYYDSQAYGQTECTPCPVGTFGRSSGADTCEVCPEGTYQDEVRLDSDHQEQSNLLPMERAMSRHL